MSDGSIHSPGSALGAVSRCDLEQLLDTAKMERLNRGPKNGKRATVVLTAIIDFAKRLDTFSQAIDMFVQGSSGIAMLIWGSLRVLIKVPWDKPIPRLGAAFPEGSFRLTTPGRD
jgi:hypothetical protein